MRYKELIQNKSFKNCSDCGGKCCKFITVPEELKYMIHTFGVPLSFYTADTADNLKEYFKLHEGINISKNGKNIIIENGVKTKSIKTRLGIQLVVYSKCSKLDENNNCTIYKNRPEVCKNFGEKTVKNFNIPKGCIYASDNQGEDFLI